MMSKKGEDFSVGGQYVERSENERIITDDLCDYGDLVYFNAECFHGVEMIDPDESEDWLSFAGRWIMLFAVNKLAENTAIANSIDLEKAKQ